MLKMLDLFSGIGGFSLAASWTGGIETVAFCEIEPFCQQVLKKHWPDVPIYPDIKELNGYEVVREHGTVDIVCGGFPCQPFSYAGKRRGTEDDRHLWPEMFRIIQETNPTWVVGENVPGLIDLALEQCFVDLESAGYEVQPLIIPACGVNAPHRRDRVWIVANSRNDTRGNGKRGSARRNGSGTMEKTEWPTKTIKIARSSKTYRIMANTNNPRNTTSRSNINRNRQEKNQGRDELAQFGVSRCSSQNVAYPNCSGLQGRSNAIQSQEGRQTYTRYDRQITCGEWRNSQWDIEPDVGRVADGIPDRTHRLKALGNSIVPQVVYPILQGIVEIERGQRP